MLFQATKVYPALKGIVFGICTRKILAYFQRKLKNLEILANIDEKSIKRYFAQKNRLPVRNIFNLTTIST